MVSTVLTRHNIVSVVSGKDFGTHKIMTARRRDGRVVSEHPLTSANVRLRAGRFDEVLVIDKGAHMLRMFDTSTRADVCVPPDRCGGSKLPPDSGHNPPDCKTCTCMPCVCHQPQRDSNNGSPAGSDNQTGGNIPLPRDPNGQCIPGDDGEPDGCFVTTYLGRMVIEINICDPTDVPCTAQLDRDIGSIRQTRNSVIVTSADGRRVNVLNRQSLRLVHESRNFQGTTSISVAQDADLIFLRDSSGNVGLLDPTPVLPSANADFDLTSNTSSAVFLGASPGVSYDSGGVQTGVRRVLIVPALEPGQGFSDFGSTASFASDSQIEEIINKVQDFYVETTRYEPDGFSTGLSVEFVWFGQDTSELYTGSPIELPNPFKFYWGPTWDPGNVQGVVPLPGSGLIVSFSGDERLELDTSPAPEDTYDTKAFEILFPAASFSSRIPNSLPTINLGSGTTRTISINGIDRQNNSFAVVVDTGVLGAPVSIDLNRLALEAGATELDNLADVIETMLDSAPGLSGLFERPRVLWHDDNDQTGMLHISLSFASGPGSVQPQVTAFDIDGLLTELDPGSLAATFSMPGDESTMATYLWRIVADAWVRHPDFGPDLSNSYFELVKSKWTPSVSIEGGELTTRISLSTEHGRDPAKIEVSSQSGLAIIGMDNPQENIGADTKFSGSGGPTFKDSTLFDHVYTEMIDRTIEANGSEEAGINIFNEFINCVGIEGTCFQTVKVSAMVVTPVYKTSFGAETEPDLVNGERGNSNRHEAIDTKADQRAAVVLPFGGNRSTMVMKIDPKNIDSSSATLAHELGHGIVGLPDLYSVSGLRDEVEYVGGHCIMGNSSSYAHFCAYNQRIKGWLDDDAILLVDRPNDDGGVDEEVVLIQLEYWDPHLSDAERIALAQSALSGMEDGTPVVAAVFLRLGGDGHLFDIVELRGQGDTYSQGITPSRVLITNALDPEDDTRYGENEVEGAGTTRGVLERYRRKVHLLSSDLRANGHIYDFASSAEFPEVGLTTEVLEWASGSGAAGNFDVVRLRIQWDRGPAIDLGFVDSTPGWQSPDIAIIKPEKIDNDGNFEFPEDQNDADEETFRVPSDPDEELIHKIAVRVWNFGDATAENVEIGLRQKRPGGSGDWDLESDIKKLLPDPLPPSSESGPQIIDFDWSVDSSFNTHVCFQAEISDYDVERDNNGVALGSDDTTTINNHTQQNAFIFEAKADSPPEPVVFMHSVENTGSYLEEVYLQPRGLGSHSKLTITPSRMKIAPFSRGIFQVNAELDERLLYANCGKDITFVLEAWRLDDHSDERWGAAKYIIKPRFRTTTILDGSLLPEKLHLYGSVSPDVGAQKVLLHIQRPGMDSIWDEVNLGPGSTFDYELLDDFPPQVEVRATAYYDGSFEYAKSVSKPFVTSWIAPG